MMLDAGLFPEKYARNRDVSMKMTAAAARRSARPEQGLRAASAEDGPDVGPLPRLQENDEDQGQGNHDVQRYYQCIHFVLRFLRYRYFTIFAKVPGARLAPPTRAPSISSRSINSAMFSGLTDPP